MTTRSTSRLNARPSRHLGLTLQSPDHRWLSFHPSNLTRTLTLTLTGAYLTLFTIGLGGALWGTTNMWVEGGLSFHSLGRLRTMTDTTFPSRSMQMAARLVIHTWIDTQGTRRRQEGEEVGLMISLVDPPAREGK